MNVIELKKVSKKYNLVNDRPVFLKNLFIRQKKQEVWALKNISLNINKGETIGIIGENGSGKSTLLKIIAGITTPTKGTTQAYGRIASLIELGAGFHPDLTGKDNVYLNGTLLGLTKKEIDKKYNEIVSFADIGSYLNQPIRAYSSGMVIRLGFSIAVHLEPNILLIDEVLAVGDGQFQNKCLQKISQLKAEGKTIVFVSHYLYLIEFICKKAIWIHQGKIGYIGSSTQAVERYVNFSREKISTKISRLNNKGLDLSIERVVLLDKNDRSVHKVLQNQYLKIRIYYKSKKRIFSPIFGIRIHNDYGYYCHGTSTFMKNMRTKTVKGEGYIEYIIKNLYLLKKSGGESPDTKYSITAFAQLEKENVVSLIDEYQNANYFYIEETSRSTQHGVVFLNGHWSKVKGLK